MARIQVYSTRWCGYCVRAKTLLESRGIEYEEISLDDDPAFRQKLFDLTGGWTVPQILIDGKPIGGYTELWRLDRDGRPRRRARRLTLQALTVRAVPRAATGGADLVDRRSAALTRLAFAAVDAEAVLHAAARHRPGSSSRAGSRPDA